MELTELLEDQSALVVLDRPSWNRKLFLRDMSGDMYTEDSVQTTAAAGCQTTLQQGRGIWQD